MHGFFFVMFATLYRIHRVLNQSELNFDILFILNLPPIFL